MSAPLNILTVSSAEDGMKLMRFMERRLEQDGGSGNYHKWIRTGQVRVNGGRAKPFELLKTGDLVRLPPFARTRHLALSVSASVKGGAAESAESRRTSGNNMPVDLDLKMIDKAGGFGPRTPLRVIADTEELAGAYAQEDRCLTTPGELIRWKNLEIAAVIGDMLVLNKGRGLASQGGTGQLDSLSSRLSAAFSECDYIPSPAHRLDKGTTGLLLAGLGHKAQKFIHAGLVNGTIIKQYLACIRGCWPNAYPVLLYDQLDVGQADKGGKFSGAVLSGCKPLCDLQLVDKVDETGFYTQIYKLLSESKYFSQYNSFSIVEQVAGTLSVLAPGRQIASLNAASNYLEQAVCSTTSLLLVTILTGRKHQIRQQLAVRNYPIIGDTKYNGPPYKKLLLHSHALSVSMPAKTLTVKLFPEWFRGK